MELATFILVMAGVLLWDTIPVTEDVPDWWPSGEWRWN